MEPYEEQNTEEEQFDSFLDVNLEEIEELHSLPRGEYELACRNIRFYSGIGKNGPWKYVGLQLETLDDPLADYVYHKLWLPSEEANDKQRVNSLIEIRKAAQAFGVNYSGGVNFYEFIGQTAWVSVDIEIYQGNSHNIIIAFLRRR